MAPAAPNHVGYLGIGSRLWAVVADAVGLEVIGGDGCGTPPILRVEHPGATVGKLLDTLASHAPAPATVSDLRGEPVAA